MAARGPDTATAVVHRYLSAQPAAGLDELRRNVPDTLDPSTVRTLWKDFQMTREAMEIGEYVDDKRLTFAIRWITCRLWDENPGNVTSRMVADELRRQGQVRKPATISRIVADTISALRALDLANSVQGAA